MDSMSIFVRNGTWKRIECYVLHFKSSTIFKYLLLAPIAQIAWQFQFDNNNSNNNGNHWIRAMYMCSVCTQVSVPNVHVRHPHEPYHSIHNGMNNWWMKSEQWTEGMQAPVHIRHTLVNCSANCQPTTLHLIHWKWKVFNLIMNCSV